MERSDTDPNGEVHENAFGAADTTVSERVVDLVAAFHGADPTEIPPIYTAIDPDGLDTLFDAPLPTPDSPVEVTFQYADLTVTVTGEETIRLSASP